MPAKGAGAILTGQKFGRLTVGERAPIPPHLKYHYAWVCTCDCGKVKEVLAKHLKRGLIVSCGCYSAEIAGARWRKHGGKGTTEYAIWKRMKQRCLDPNDKGYKNWGGRGITVCKQWQDSFPAFLQDMGPRPSKRYTIDRINNDGNYEPGNCEWATYAAQARNTRVNVLNANKVLMIRAKSSAGASDSMLAKEFGTSRACIWAVTHNKTWRPENV